MSEDVKIENLGGLTTYGESINRFTTTYREAIVGTYQTFSLKTDPDTVQGKAFEAFLNKLNSIQAEIFDAYPDELDQIAGYYTSYASELSGLGFNKRVWSRLSGAQSVKSTLENTISERITNKQKSLQSALDEATSLLGIAEEDLSTTTNGATEALANSGSQRVSLASSIDTAFTTFKSNLSEGQNQIDSLLSKINNISLIVNNIPVSTIATAIVSGKLTENEINYLGAVQTKDDAIALNAVLSGDYSKLSTVNVENISETTYVSLANEFIDIANVEHQEEFNELLSVLGEMPFTQSTYFIQKIIIGADVVSYALQSQVLSGDELSQETKSLLITRRDNWNRFTSVMTLLYAENYGAQITDYYDDEHYSTSPVVARVNFEDDSITLTIDDMHSAALRGDTNYTTTYTIDLYTNSNNYHLAEGNNRLSELAKARQTAAIQLVADIALVGTSLVAPDVKAIADALQSIATISLSGAASSVSSGLELSAKGQAWLTGVSKIAQAAIDYQQSVKGLSKAEKEQLAQVKAEFFNQGGYITKSGDDVVNSSRTVLDYGVTLAKHDLDTNGFTNYVQSRGGDLEQFKKDIDDYSKIEISEDMKQYALGNSDLTFDQLTPEQMTELETIQGIAEKSATGDDSSSWNGAKDDYQKYIMELGE